MHTVKPITTCVRTQMNSIQQAFRENKRAEKNTPIKPAISNAEVSQAPFFFVSATREREKRERDCNCPSSM